MYRLERNGVVQKWVEPILGFYPWQCKACGTDAKLRKRYRRRRVHVTG
jgi:hypothetical protein